MMAVRKSVRSWLAGREEFSVWVAWLEEKFLMYSNFRILDSQIHDVMECLCKKQEIQEILSNLSFLSEKSEKCGQELNSRSFFVFQESSKKRNLRSLHADFDMF